MHKPSAVHWGRIHYAPVHNQAHPNAFHYRMLHQGYALRLERSQYCTVPAQSWFDTIEEDLAGSFRPSALEFPSRIQPDFHFFLETHFQID